VWNPNQGVIVEQILADPGLRHVYFDISWDEVAKYLLATPEITRRSANLINRYPDRFLFGSDVVAPRDTTQYYAVFNMYGRVVADAGSQRESAEETTSAYRRRPRESRLGAGPQAVAAPLAPRPSPL
jgi:hypothetical protein